MQEGEDETTKIHELPEGKWMLSSKDSYITEQYRTICQSNGKTQLEKLGIFDNRNQVEKILGMIRERPILLGQDPQNRFLKKYGGAP